jgi:hypothetical protein
LDPAGFSFSGVSLLALIEMCPGLPITQIKVLTP